MPQAHPFVSCCVMLCANQQGVVPLTACAVFVHSLCAICVPAAPLRTAMLGTGATALAPAGGTGEALAAAKREHVLFGKRSYSGNCQFLWMLP